MVADQAQEQVGAPLVAESEASTFDLLSDPLEHSLQGGAAVVRGKRGPPGDLVAHLRVVARGIAGDLWDLLRCDADRIPPGRAPEGRVQDGPNRMVEADDSGQFQRPSRTRTASRQDSRLWRGLTDDPALSLLDAARAVGGLVGTTSNWVIFTLMPLTELPRLPSADAHGAGLRIRIVSRGVGINPGSTTLSPVPPFAPRQSTKGRGQRGHPPA